MAINFPQIDPVIFHVVGPIAIRWYSLAYIAGIILGIYYLKYLSRGFLELPKEKLDSLTTYSVLGIVLGGRLGYVLFYNLAEYLQHPLSIFATWNGGMSFHGGVIGFAIAIYLFTNKYKIDFLRLGDLLACVAPIGLFFGRIANFINAELYGHITNVPWGVIFPNESLPRHPSQIYEALTEGLLCFIILSLLFFNTKIKYCKGALAGSFLTIYSVSRVIIEFFREPDMHIGYLFYHVTTGQLLSLPMLIFGLFFIIRARKNGYQL